MEKKQNKDFFELSRKEMEETTGGSAATILSFLVNLMVMVPSAVAW